MNLPWNFSALPATIHYVIGVDGGGTHTRARVIHRSRTVVGEGRAGASGLVQGIPQAWRHIGDAIAMAVQGRAPPEWPVQVPDNTALGLGLAGANNTQWHAQCVQANPGYARLVLESDAVTALAGAHQGQPGALIIMGTGSVGLALHPNGERATMGGWGFPSGDEGSGAILGLHAVNLTQRAVDGRHAPTPLTQAVLQTVGGTSTSLMTWCGAARQFEYASLAPLVFAHEAHDPAAAYLIEMAVQSLYALAIALDPGHRLPLVVTGSIGQRLQARLPSHIAQCLVPAQGDAMDGALALCFR